VQGGSLAVDPVEQRLPARRLVQLEVGEPVVLRHRWRPGLGRRGLDEPGDRVALLTRPGEPCPQHRRGVVQQRPQGPGAAGAGYLGPAEVGRAQPRDGLRHVHGVRTAEEGEEVVGVVPRRRRGAVAGEGAGHDRRHRVPGRGADRRRVAEPRRGVGERGQVRVEVGVDPAVGADDGREGELVEDEEHDRGRGSDVGLERVGVVVEQGRRLRREQEEPDEGEWRERRVPEPEPERLAAAGEHEGDGRHGGGRREERGAAEQRPQRLHRDGAGEQAEQRRVQGRAGLRCGEPGDRFGRPEHQRRHGSDDGGEQHDVGARRSPERELLGAAAEHVEQRLGDGDAAQGEQLGEGTQLPPQRAHLGRHRNSVLRPDGSTSRAATSKRSARAASNASTP
jgi:hypothetical protein